jgi:hypothetical protein
VSSVGLAIGRMPMRFDQFGYRCACHPWLKLGNLGVDSCLLVV